MEEQLERKETSTDPRESVKSEGLVQSPNTSERSDGATSPPPNCSICLGKLVNTSFTDSCLHQFCFTCLLEWSKIKTECPLCKQTFKSIIHNVRSEEDYDQYHVPRHFASQMSQSQVAATLDVNFDLVGMNVDVGLRRFVYRTTMTPNRRYGMLLNSEQVTRLNAPSQISREERRWRRTNPTDYRRNVYRYGVWSTSLPDIFGRFRECSAEYYRRQPSELTRLVPWLNRELQVLLSDDAPHVAYVMNVIMDALSQYDMRSPEFRDIIRPYFNMHTDHFVHELLNYARTSFSLAGYDQCVTYVPSHGLSNEYVPNAYITSSSSSTSSSEDSDIRVVDETIDMSRLNAELPTYLPHRMGMPGPSTVGQTLNLQVGHRSFPDVLTISSDSSLSSDNECEVVGYVKPRHEIRTPEIVELSSTDVEEVNIPILHESVKYENPVDLNSCPPFFGSTSVSLPGEDVQPSTSHTDKRETRRTKCRVGRRKTSKSLFSSSDDSDSDSSFSPERRKKSKSSSKKSNILSRNSQIKQNKWLSDKRRRNKVSKLSETSDESEFETRSCRNDRKVGKLEVKQEAKKRYVSSLSDSSSEKNEKQARDIEKFSSLKLHKDLTKKKEKYIKSDSSRSKSSSDSDINRRKIEKSQQEGRKRYLSSSSSSSSDRNEKQTRNQDKVTKSEDVEAAKLRKDLRKAEERYTKDKPSNKGNIDATYKSLRGKKSESKRYYSTDEYEKEKETRKNKNKYNSQDDKDSTKRESRRRNIIDYSTSDSERNLLGMRSNSQCSIRSDKTYANKKKSKHKEKHRDKKERHSSSKSVTLCQSVTNLATIPSSKNDLPSTSVHSDSKNDLNSKGRHKSHKKHKESRHRKSRSESKSKSKKKKRRIKSSSLSNSE